VLLWTIFIESMLLHDILTILSGEPYAPGPGDSLRSSGFLSLLPMLKN